jgi:regulatory protein
MISSAQEIIITKLLEENYLNETRFSQSFARGKFRIKKWGKERIIRELKARKISDYNIKKGLREISDEDYSETFYTLFEKRKASVGHYPLYERKRKILDYMIYRGWEKEKIYASLNDLKT